MKLQIIKNEKGVQLISARELHTFLESKQDFTTWIKNRIDKYDLTENEDFTFHKFMEGKSWKHDYILKLDTAKELSMVEGNEKGKQARKYFIECEKQLQNQFRVPQTFKEALMLAVEQQDHIEKLQLKIKNDKARVGFAETIEKASSDILFRDMSKILANEGIKLGQNKLYTWCRGKGLILGKGTMPSQRAVEQGLFRVTTRLVKTIKGDIESITCKITGKGQVYILQKLKEEMGVD